MMQFLIKSTQSLQEAMPGCIHTVLLLADRDLALRMEKASSVQVTHTQTHIMLPFYFNVTVNIL